MFDTILIANRGEIACRVMETAQAMGVRCIAVYSDADVGAKHRAMADGAVHIGGAAPADSYLRADAIIAAARQSGAQAIHPGYGFLSENPEFVEAVEQAGLVFIGPSAKAIRAMGLKDAAKALMETAGVPVVPGYHGDNQDPAYLASEAAKIGYPVLIKAVAGGGGKGMRLIDSAEAFADGLASAQAEARTAFGNDAVLVEKFVAKPRHIEVQVFGDGTHAVHLFERDCSLQRRHQKVIEEAPAPGMTEDMRTAMGAAAVRAAEAIGYKGAGTVEFIVDASDGLRADRFYFMEMNTRLQVEHPVTEAVTGIDLVAWQLRVAAGEPLPKRQEDLTLQGHAFEARLYAEDVPKGFLPATGTLTHLAFPENARADSGVRAGDTISPWYDPMIAKVVVDGPTREIALKRLTQALAETQVAGTVTNLALLGALSAEPRFVAGDVDTGLIADTLETLVQVPMPEPRQIVAAALIASNVAEPQTARGFTLWSPLVCSITLRHGEDLHVVTLEMDGDDRCTCKAGNTVIEAIRHGGLWHVEGRALPAFALHERTLTLFEQHGIVFEIPDPLARGSADTGNADVIEAPMPGLLREMLARPGQAVAQGDKLAVLEAMKMEHSLTAARDGVVAEVLADAGAQVEAGAALVRLEEE